jgi:hypothetical protein
LEAPAGAEFLGKAREVDLATSEEARTGGDVDAGLAALEAPAATLIAELGEDNLYHLGSDGLEPISMVMVEFRRGRPAEKRLALGRAIVDVCVELLAVPRRTVMVEFTPHPGEEILRDGNWTADWTPAEAVSG